MSRRGVFSDPTLVPVSRERNPGNTSVRCPIDGDVVHFDTDGNGRVVEHCPSCARRKIAEARLAEIRSRNTPPQLPARYRCRNCPGRIEPPRRVCDECQAKTRQRNRRRWYVGMTPERKAAFIARCTENARKRKRANAHHPTGEPNE